MAPAQTKYLAFTCDRQDLTLTSRDCSDFYLQLSENLMCPEKGKLDSAHFLGTAVLDCSTTKVLDIPGIGTTWESSNLREMTFSTKLRRRKKMASQSVDCNSYTGNNQWHSVIVQL
jgi:hypothetical protein